MRCFLRLTVVFLFLQTGVSSSAQESWVEGTWIGVSIAAPSQFGGAAEARALEFVSETVQIDGGKITLPNQIVCALQKPATEIWQNDMYTFGSFGGDWTEIGLHRSTTGFEVTTWQINCADEYERLTQMVAQPEQGTFLLDVGRVFVTLQR